MANASEVQELVDTVSNVDDAICKTAQELNRLTAALDTETNRINAPIEHKNDDNDNKNDDDNDTFVGNTDLINNNDMIDFTKQIEANFDMNEIRKLFKPIPKENNNNNNKKKIEEEEDKNNDEIDDEIDINALQTDLAEFVGNINNKNNKNNNYNDNNDNDDVDIDLNILQNNFQEFFGLNNGLQSMFDDNYNDIDDIGDDADDEESDVDVSRIQKEIEKFFTQKAMENDDNDDDDDEKHEFDEENDDNINFETDLSNLENMKTLFMENINKKNDDNKENEENDIDILEKLALNELMEKSQIKNIKLRERNCTLNCLLINEEYLNIDDDNKENKEKNKYYPLLLLHGLCDSRKTWNGLLPKLISYQQCIITVSLRGFGDSQQFDNNNSMFSMDEYLNDLMELLKELNISKAIWIGHDLGSFIAQKAAIENKEIVHKMILIAPNYTLLNEIGIKWKEILINNNNIDNFIKKTRNLKNINNNKQYMDDMINECKKCEIKILNKTLESMMKFNCLNYLKYIQCPVYILIGGNDKIFEKQYGYKINKYIKSSLITCFPEMNHYFIWNKSIISRLAIIIWDFCRQ